MPLIFCDVETCNCDQCRYRRWDMTLAVSSITVRTIDEAIRGNLAEFVADDRLKLNRFLEREANGEIKSPRGPFTEKNGWKRGEYGVQWGGGPVT